MLEVFQLPGSIVSLDIIVLNDVTQVKSWKFPAGTSELRPLCVPQVRLGIIQGETQQSVSSMFVYMVSFHMQQLTFQWYLETCVS